MAAELTSTNQVHLAEWVRSICASQGMVVDQVSIYSRADFWGSPTTDVKFEIVADKAPPGGVPESAELRRTGADVPFDLHTVLTLGTIVMRNRFADLGIRAAVKATRFQVVGEKRREAVVMTLRVPTDRVVEHKLPNLK